MTDVRDELRAVRDAIAALRADLDAFATDVRDWHTEWDRTRIKGR